MPQVFGVLSPGGSGVFSTACPLYDSRLVREDRRRFNRDLPPELFRANCLYVPGGKWPARGWILLRRGDYDNLTSKYSRFALQIDDFKNGPVTFQNLVIVQARCMTRGTEANRDAIYLVEITDQRGVLWNRWFSFPTTSQYNVRSPAYPEQYYLPSLDAGVVWTWQTMIRDLWNQMGTFLGAFPGMPLTPVGGPENFLFPGESCWLALNRVLDLLGCSVSADLTQTAPYTIDQEGAADPVFAAATARYEGLKEDDYEWIDTGSGRVPGTVIVYFHRRNQYYGTEETVRRDTLQWSSTPLYPVPLAAPATFLGATGTAFLWDDFTVRYDVDNTPLAADVVTANLIAAERVTQLFRQIFDGTAGNMKRVYAGALPFAAGSLVDGVCWKEDYREGRLAWRTEVIRNSDQPPWPEVAVDE